MKYWSWSYKTHAEVKFYMVLLGQTELLRVWIRTSMPEPRTMPEPARQTNDHANGPHRGRRGGRPVRLRV